MADMYVPVAVGGTVYFAQPDALKVINHIMSKLE